MNAHRRVVFEYVVAVAAILGWIALGVLLSGCVGPRTVQVASSANGGMYGHGAPIGSQTVLTLGHIVTGDEALVGLGHGVWLPAHVIRRVRVFQDELVTLEVPHAYFEGFETRPVIQGDSGTPLLSADGRVMGLLRARRMGELVVVPIEAGE